MFINVKDEYQKYILRSMRKMPTTLLKFPRHYVKLSTVPLYRNKIDYTNLYLLHSLLLIWTFCGNILAVFF